jgi:AcrR family transcriptional regulator
MNERVKVLRGMEPKNAGRASYQAILEAAAGLFGQIPAMDITLRDILSIAGVSNQTLYNYFPNGRDDIAIMLYDRFQRTMVEDFNNHISLIKLNDHQNELAFINKLSICLVRAVFGFLKNTLPIQSSLFTYLKDHHLLSIATHSEELEEALAQVIIQQMGGRFSRMELPRINRLSVRLVREIAINALENSAFDLDKLESNARKVVRATLKTGLKEPEGPSGDHRTYVQGPASSAIVGAPISPMKKQNILERILKRKGRGLA